MKVYLIPGLGADGRMYESLIHLLPDSEVLEWFVPLPDEGFQDYIDRFSKQIKTKEPFALIGNSMGGILAIELTKRIKADKVIIISSVKCRKELPHYIRLGKYISLFRNTTGKFYNVVNRAILKLLQLRSEKKFLQLVLDMSKDANAEFISWSIKKVMQWNNNIYPHDIIHIHGTMDTLFPIIYVENCIRIKGGTHMMMMERSDEINSIIIESLNK